MVDTPELGGVQALFARSVLERFPEAVLPGFARLDVVGRRSLGLEPFRELEGDDRVHCQEWDGRSSPVGEEPGEHSLGFRRPQGSSSHGHGHMEERAPYCNFRMVEAAYAGGVSWAVNIIGKSWARDSAVSANLKVALGRGYR